MDKEAAIQKSLELADRAEIATLGINGDDGYPKAKAMLKMENVGLAEVWFSTNISSRAVAQLTRDNKACVYFMDAETFEGLMLAGEVEVLTDAQSRQRIWRDGFEKYYTGGVNDPDYCVLRFTSRRGNYYCGLHNVDFDL